MSYTPTIAFPGFLKKGELLLSLLLFLLLRTCELPQSGSGCTDLHGEIKVPLHRDQGCFLDESYTSEAEAKYIQKERFTLSTGKQCEKFK